MGGSLVAWMTAGPSGCVGIVGPRGRPRSSRTSVLFLRWSGSDWNCSCCSGVEVDGVGWCASSTRGSWGSCRGDFGKHCVVGTGSLSSSMVGCWVGGRVGSAAGTRERWRSRTGSIERCA